MTIEGKNRLADLGDLIRAGETQTVREFLETVEGDSMVFEESEVSRREAESLGEWIKTKELAEQEADSLSPNALVELIQAAKPYVDALPAGHSKGHFLRDAIHLSMILKDPAYAEIERVELLAGIFGGIFHDIGNSVVERYADSVRFASHAEVGGFVFKELAKGILPPNILKLSELAIDAHTDYQGEIEIIRDGKSVIKRPYEDEVVDGGRIAVWIPRQADRMDGQDITWLVRKILVTTRPTEDFSWDTGFVRVWPSEEADFLHQYAIRRRSKATRLSLPKGSLERRPNILETTEEHERSALAKDSPYNIYDSEYFSGLLLPKTARQMRFVSAVEENPPRYDEEVRERIIDKFLEVCRILEPSADVDYVTQELRKKLGSLPVDLQNHWARGFEVLTNELYPRWFHETRRLLGTKPSLSDPKLQEFIDALHTVSTDAIDVFDPRRIES